MLLFAKMSQGFMSVLEADGRSSLCSGIALRAAVEPTPKRGGRANPEGVHEPSCSLSAVSTVSSCEPAPPLGLKLTTAVFLLLSAKRSNS